MRRETLNTIELQNRDTQNYFQNGLFLATRKVKIGCFFSLRIISKSQPILLRIAEVSIF